jgi:iron complex outermembrane receptor protein
MKKLILSTITLVIFTCVNAQDTTKNYVLSDIEVVGVRADSKTPVTQKKITKEDIAKTYQGQEMSYILSNSPSIGLSSDGGHAQGYTYFRLRGIDQTRVNMTLNGVPLNEPEDQGVYFSNYPMFATNIESMQIQRGVGSSSNGTASYAGSINFESRNGLDSSTSIQSGYSSFNTMRFNASHSTGIISNNIAAFGSFSSYNSDGYKYNSGGHGYSGFLSIGYYGEKNVIKFTGFSGFSHNDMAWLAVSESDIKKDPRTNYNPKGEDDNFKQSFSQLQYVRELGQRSTLTTTAYYNRLDGLWGMFMDSVNIMKFGLASNFYGIMTNYHLEKNKLNINIGAHANSYNREHRMNIPSLSNDYVYTNTGYKTDFSAYTKASYDIGKVTLFGDAQIRQVDFNYNGDVAMKNLSWTFFNPKGGITLRQNNKISYYASVGQSHREPTRTDMFGGSDNLTTLNIITPEEVVDYEVGSNICYNKLRFQANVFYMDFKNEITLLGALGANGNPLMTNVTKSYRSGLEIDLSYRIGKYITLVNNSSYMDCKITNNGKTTEPLYTPNIMVNQSVEFLYKRFFMSVAAKYHSESYIDFENTATTPSFVVFDYNVGYKYKHCSILAQANNITNQSYYTNGYVFAGEKYFFVNAPMNFSVTFKAEF